MTKYFTYSIFLCFSLLSNLSIGQTQIEIINADEISFNKKISEDRQLLLGNVRTKHEGRYLNCDSAYYYATENKIEAFSNINIWQGDTLNLKGNYLLYHGNHALAEIHQNVRFNHKNMKLLTEQLNYNFATNEGFFDTKASITNEEKSLWSNKGVYYSSIEKFDFFGDVLIIEGEEIIKADTLYYWLDSEFASFRSNGEIENSDIKILAQEGWIDQIAGNAFLSDRIKITQSKDSYTLYTDTCIITDQMNHSLSYGNTLLNFPFNDDTLYLTADTLINYQTTASTIVKAYKDVNFKSTTITGQSDSLSFNTQSNLIYLNQEPVLWLEEFQLTADTISLFLDSNKLEKVYLNKNAFISSELDSISFNQISGINMLANFKENDLHSINVMGNGESIYYIQDDVTDEILGLNKIICSNMNIRIDDRALKNIKFLQKPDATLFPIAEIKETLRWLKHYNNRNKLAVLNKIETKTQVHKGF